MSAQSLLEDPVALVLLGGMVLLIGLPVAALITWRMTTPPVRSGSLRCFYLAWALLLAASSVWNLSREVRFSADEAGSDNFVRLIFLLLGSLIILIVGYRHKFAFVPESLTGALGIFSAFAAWGLASTLWSVAPASTLYKSVEYGAMLALFGLAASVIFHSARGLHDRMLILKSIFDWNWFLVLALIVSAYVGAFILPAYAIVPSKGVLGFSLQGALPGIAANGLGQLAAILGIVALVRVLLKPQSRILYLALFAFCLVTIVLAQSRSPILAFALAVIVVLFASRRLGLLAFSGLSLVAVMFSAFGGTLVEFMERGQSTGEITTLTGRTVYWRASLEAVAESPLTGYGANAGGRYILDEVFGTTGVSTTHNLWVEVLVDTGAVGLILMIAGVGAALFWLLRLRCKASRNPISHLLWLECLGVATILCVRSVFSVPLVWSSTVLIFGLILLFVNVMRRQSTQEDRADFLPAQRLPQPQGPGVRD